MDLSDTQKRNKKLVEEYPFLQLRDPWTGDVYDDEDYSFTMLDDMPEGWRNAFGIKMCDEIKEELIRCKYLDEYRVVQVKEKFGALRWYDYGVPDGCRVPDIINTYEKISAYTCIRCGKPATKISNGWICPWCDDCAKEVGGKFEPIEEWFKF